MPGRPWGERDADAQTAFLGRHYFGKSTREIADALGTTLRTVVRWIRDIENGIIPWPPPEYARYVREMTQHYGTQCPQCGHHFLPQPAPDGFFDKRTRTFRRFGVPRRR